jgi:hypothetical protein
LWSEYLVAKTGDIGALTNLAKADSTVASTLFYDPAKEFEYNEKKLALSLKTIYQLDFEDFVTGAQRYSDSATSQFDAWLKAGKPLLPK